MTEELQKQDAAVEKAGAADASAVDKAIVAAVDAAKKFDRRHGVGMGIGAIVGLVFGGPLTAVMGAVAGVGLAQAAPPRLKDHDPTPEQNEVFKRAMFSSELPPEALEQLASEFGRRRLRAHAHLLRRKAASLRLPKAVAEQRLRDFRRGMCSEKPDGVDKLATTFAHEGLLVAAGALRDHARDVRRLNGAALEPAAIDGFEKKWGAAIEHFGLESGEAASAKRNLDRARGSSEEKKDGDVDVEKKTDDAVPGMTT